MRPCTASVWQRPFAGFTIQSAETCIPESPWLETQRRRDAEDAEKRARKESLYGFRVSSTRWLHSGPQATRPSFGSGAARHDTGSKRHGRASIQRDSGCGRIAHGHLPPRIMAKAIRITIMVMTPWDQGDYLRAGNRTIFHRVVQMKDAVGVVGVIGIVGVVGRRLYKSWFVGQYGGESVRVGSHHVSGPAETIIESGVPAGIRLVDRLPVVRPPHHGVFPCLSIRFPTTRS